MSEVKDEYKTSREGMSEEAGKMVDEYLLWLKDHDLTETTIYHYRRIVERFLGDCSVPIHELRTVDVYMWFVETFEQPYFKKKPHMERLAYFALLSFFRFCRKKGYVKTKIMEGLRPPKKKGTRPKILNLQEINRVMEAADTMKIQERVKIYVLLFTGCRVAEFEKLKIRDVKIDKRTVSIHDGKRSHRTVPLPEKLVPVVEEYLQTLSGDNAEYLFPEMSNREWGTRELYRMTKKVGKLAEIGFLRPSDLRNTFASMMKSAKPLSELVPGKGSNPSAYLNIKYHPQIRRVKK